MLKRIKNDNHGAAMAVALLCIMVLSLLGAALWQYFMADTNHTAKDEKGMQAYYLARSGADALARYIVKNPDNKTKAEMETFISTLSASPKSDVVAFGKGTFSVQVTRDPGNTLHIKSEGIVGDTKKNINLKLIPEGIPDTPDDAVDASIKSLFWLKGDSGNINKSSVGKVTYPVKFDPSNSGIEDIHLRPKGNPNVDPSFTAPGLYFEHDLTVDSNAILTLRADTIVVRGKLILNDKGNDFLSLVNLAGPYDSNKIDESLIPGAVSGKQYGIVYFKDGIYVDSRRMVPPGGYYFPEGCVFPPKGMDLDDDWDENDAGLIYIGSVDGYREVWN